MYEPNVEMALAALTAAKGLVDSVQALDASETVEVQRLLECAILHLMPSSGGVRTLEKLA